MAIDRRQFLGGLALAASGFKVPAEALGFSGGTGSPSDSKNNKTKGKAYGSGHFGHWIEDEFGLPAFHYTCDQIKDPKAVTEVNPGILAPTEHIHQVGNDRIVAIASNYGHVRVRQDEGAPKFLNDYAPGRGCFGGGIGYLSDGTASLSTHYPGNAETFDRIFGIGYLQKKVSGHGYEIDHVIFAPFGDDPVLFSQVTVTNHNHSEAELRWVEYWGCQVYEFSFRAFMESGGQKMTDLRREFGERFSHRFQPDEDGLGLVESKKFLGRTLVEDERWRQTLAYLEKNPNPFLTLPDKNVPKDASFEDLNPPPTFLISLDGRPDGRSTNGKGFFGSGGVDHPSGLGHELDGDLSQTGDGSALLLEHKMKLRHGKSHTFTFLYGYLPKDTSLDWMISKYRSSARSVLQISSNQWKKKGLRLVAKEEPWVDREITWNHYYLRSNLTLDTFFRHHIISQASIYQYVMGFQGAARDPLQHVLPFVFSDPGIVKEILRYTLEEVRPDGSIPYGITGHGMIMPTTSDDSSDMPLWLLWVTSEYVLATRDKSFLAQPIITAYGTGAGKARVVDLLARCYGHLVKDVGTGQHGLMRMLHDDWNDALVLAWVPPQSIGECVKQSESVLNSAMASYVFDHYARLLAYAGGAPGYVAEVRKHAEEQREAVRRQWMGKWFRRAWLGPSLGWLGEKGLWISPQPWAIIGGAASKDQTQELVQVIDKELRQPSPIGAAQLSKSPDMETHGVWKVAPGTSVCGGVWPSLNQTLIWALAQVDGEKAWNEWKKNSFARHAEVYPDVWYGTWSGPDVLNSTFSEHPGETTGGHPFGWTDFPVMNMHTHACPLFAASKLLGLEFTETGLTLAPKVPLKSYRFNSPLLGVVKNSHGYEGWYDPRYQETWIIRLKLEPEEAKDFRKVVVNGTRVHHSVSSDGVIELKGSGGAGNPLRWSVRR